MHVRVDSLMLMSRSVNSLQMLSRLQDWVQNFQAPFKKGLTPWDQWHNRTCKVMVWWMLYHVFSTGNVWEVNVWLCKGYSPQARWRRRDHCSASSGVVQYKLKHDVISVTHVFVTLVTAFNIYERTVRGCEGEGLGQLSGSRGEMRGDESGEQIKMLIPYQWKYLAN